VADHGAPLVSGNFARRLPVPALPYSLRNPQNSLYTGCHYSGTGVDLPDFLGVVDVQPGSDTYGQIVHRTSLPYVGDELHHFGWQTCSSSNGACGMERRYLILPGFRSSRVHILDVKSDPRRPQIARVIEPKELIKKTGYSRPHTVHCLPGGIVLLSMMGDAEGNAGGGLAVLDANTFDVLGRYGCNTLDEALDSVRTDQPDQADARPFDYIILGGGSFGSVIAAR